MPKRNTGIAEHFCIASLILVFIICALMSLLFGARIYKSVSGNIDRQYGVHTAAEYIVTRLHNYDAQGKISISMLEDTPAIELRETAEDGEYVTYLYCRDGWLCELYCAADSGLGADSGTEILKLESLELSEEESGLVSLRCGLDGDYASVRMFIQSEAGGAGL